MSNMPVATHSPERSGPLDDGKVTGVSIHRHSTESPFNNLSTTLLFLPHFFDMKSPCPLLDTRPSLLLEGPHLLLFEVPTL
jgi:hypothetical protein